MFGLAVLTERRAQERGWRFARLDAYEANPHSVRFYRKLGLRSGDV